MILLLSSLTLSDMQLYALQYDIAWENKPANHRKIRAMLQSSPPAPNTLLILPEMFSTGFSMNVPIATDTPSDTDQSFLRQLACDYQIHILAGIATTAPNGKGLNQALLLSPDGAELHRYTKLHPFAPGKEALHYLPGQPSCIAAIPIHNLRLTPFICYDLRFPEIFRYATQHHQTEFFIVIANWPEARIHHWTALLQARAIENQAYVLGLNRTGRDPFLPYPGRSALFSPRGELISQLDASESLLRATLDPSCVHTCRQELPFLNDMRTDILR